jgi:hypothetical protein
VNCPQCGQALDSRSLECNNCGFNVSSVNWVVLTKVYPPNDLVVESLLTSYGILHKIIRHDIPQMPVTVGPLAEVKVMVPEQVLTEAQALLEDLMDQSN